MLGRSPLVIVTYGLFFLSGIAGLGYQIVWTRMFAVGLGHELPAMLAVVTAFFGGFAIGAFAFDRRVSESAVPGRWYAALEAVIGAWALLSIAAIPWINEQIASILGIAPGPVKQGLVAFAVPCLALLPATAAMGATLPAIDRLASRLRDDGRSVGGLYAVNTLGAVVGTLGAAFVLVPALGYPATIVALAATNFACAAAAVLGPARGEVERPPVEAPRATGLGTRQLRALAAGTGLLGIGYEVVAVRVLAQVLENTVFSFASALSLYLLGTAIGAALYQRFFPRQPGPGVLAGLLHALAAACAIGVAILWNAPSIYDGRLAGFGGGFVGAILAEMTVAALVFLPPTLLMGATFSHVAQAARHTKGGVGSALGLNTLGGAAAPFLFGVAVFSVLGGKFTLLAIAAGYLVLSPTKRLALTAPAAAVVLLVGFVPRSLLLVEAGHGRTVIAAREGVEATAAVLRSPVETVLSVNNHYQMGGTGPGEFLERRQAHLPLLLHPEPKRALFLGLGTGITFAAAERHPDLEAEGVELLRPVVDLLESFRPANAALFESDRLTLRVADARRFVRATPTRYDVIVADLFHPSRDGAGSLYTEEHFETVRARLAPDGLFCQWLPLYQVDEAVLRMIVATFLEAFPHAGALWAYFNVETPVLGLIGGEQPLSLDRERHEARLRDRGLQEALTLDGLGRFTDVVASWAASRRDLEALADDAPTNTDARPRVTFAAPRFAYLGRNEGRRLLEDLLDRFEPRAEDLVSGGTGEGSAASAGERDSHAALGDLLSARDLYLRGSIFAARGDEASGIDALMRALERSRDFELGYVPVLEYARRQIPNRPRVARELLDRLWKARPERPEARQLLSRLPR